MAAGGNSGAVAGLYADLAAERPAQAARRFAADGWYAYGADEDERAPRVVAVGHDEVERALIADLAPATARPEVLVCVQEGSDCLVEARLLDRAAATPTATVVASFQLGASGAIMRAFTFRVAPIEAPSPSDPPASGARLDGRAALDRYFDALDSARFEDAVGCFSEDVLYSHPPYWPGAPRAEFRGRDELRAGFSARGPRRNHHEITVCVQHGSDCFAEGYSHKPDSGQKGQFVASARLDGDGLIRRYAAFISDAPVGRR